MIEPRFYSIEKAAVEYLTSLDAARRSSDESAVQKFVRWFGRQRGVDAVRTRDIDGYCDTALPAEASALRGFLSYTYKQGLSVRGLASHVKSRKDSQASTPANPEPDDAIHVTEEGLASLRSELANLKEQSITVTDQMRKAAADKDFRENAPLHAAREQKSHIEGRIQEIEYMLRNAVIIAPNASRDSVGIGNHVTIQEQGQPEETYHVVGAKEADPRNGRISNESPIGRALMDHKVGDTVDVETPGGKIKFKIVKIE